MMNPITGCKTEATDAAGSKLGGTAEPEDVVPELGLLELNTAGGMVELETHRGRKFISQTE